MQAIVLILGARGRFGLAAARAFADAGWRVLGQMRPGAQAGAEDRIAVFEAIGSKRKALAVFEGGSHSMFTDRPGTGGTELNPRVKVATKELSLAFLQNNFGQGRPSAMAQCVERHRQIIAKVDGVFA